MGFCCYTLDQILSVFMLKTTSTFWITVKQTRIEEVTKEEVAEALRKTRTDRVALAALSSREFQALCYWKTQCALFQAF